MSRSPERTTAPPISVGSTLQVSRTVRFRRFVNAEASRCFCASSSAVAEITSASATLSYSAFSSS